MFSHTLSLKKFAKGYFVSHHYWFLFVFSSADTGCIGKNIIHGITNPFQRLIPEMGIALCHLLTFRINCPVAALVCCWSRVAIAFLTELSLT